MTRSDIDHYAGLDSWGPVSAAEVWGLMGELALPAVPRVIDVGCGPATTLLRLAADRGAAVTGVDKSEAALALARSAAVDQGLDERATWLSTPMNDLAFDAGSFDVVMSLGGPYRNDDRPATFALYAQWMTPEGFLVYGDGFWASPPPAAYQEATGIAETELCDREGYLAQARAAGLESVAHHIATREAWDHFEGTILANHEAHAAAHPEDGAIQAMIKGKRAFNAAQLSWGRDTLGFCVDVFRRKA